MWGMASVVSSGNLWKEIVADRPCSLCMVSMMSLIRQISDTCSRQEPRAHMVNLDAFCIPLFSASRDLSSKMKSWKQKSEHMATLIKGVMLFFHFQTHCSHTDLTALSYGAFSYSHEKFAFLDRKIEWACVIKYLYFCFLRNDVLSKFLSNCLIIKVTFQGFFVNKQEGCSYFWRPRSRSLFWLITEMGLEPKFDINQAAVFAIRFRVSQSSAWGYSASYEIFTGPERQCDFV